MTHSFSATSHFTRRQFLQLTGGSMATLVLTACVAPTAPATAEQAVASAPQRGGILRVALPEATFSLNPSLTATSADLAVVFAIYDTLTILNEADPERPVEAGLAERWEADEALTAWTFHLRQGVQFQHGTPFTSRDVEYTFGRLLDPNYGSPALDNLRVVDRLEVVDEFTVRFHLRRPDAIFPAALGRVGMNIVPHDRTDDELAATPSGTGPFRWHEHTPGESTKLLRHENYWAEGLPYLDELHLYYLPDAIARVAALQSGTVDVVVQLGAPNVALAESDPNLKIVQNPLGNMLMFIMRADQAPFDDVRVRQAFKLVVDRSAMLQAVNLGLGGVTNDQPVPPGSPYWADLPVPTPDLEKAKELLTAAGYADGLTVTLYTAEVAPGLVEAPVAFQEMAKAAGITVTIERIAPDQYYTQYYMQTPFFMSYWPAFFDPAPILQLAFYSTAVFNESGWQNSELDTLIDTLRSEPEMTKRKEIYATIQALIKNEGSVIVPYVTPLLFGAHHTVQDLVPFIIFNARKVWLNTSS